MHIRTLLSVLRTRGRVLRCELELYQGDVDAERLDVRLYGAHGVKRVHHLIYTSRPGLYPSIDREPPFGIEVNPITAREWTDHVSSTGKSGECALWCTPNSCTLRSRMEEPPDTGGVRRSIQTEIRIQLNDLDMFEVAQDTCIVFPLWELRAAIGVPDQLRVPLKLAFGYGGDPLFVYLDQAPVHAEFIIATTGEDEQPAPGSNAAAEPAATEALPRSSRRHAAAPQAVMKAPPSSPPAAPPSDTHADTRASDALGTAGAHALPPAAARADAEAAPPSPAQQRTPSQRSRPHGLATEATPPSPSPHHWRPGTPDADMFAEPEPPIPTVSYPAASPLPGSSDSEDVLPVPKRVRASNGGASRDTTRAPPSSGAAGTATEGGMASVVHPTPVERGGSRDEFPSSMLGGAGEASPPDALGAEWSPPPSDEVFAPTQAEGNARKKVRCDARKASYSTDTMGAAGGRTHACFTECLTACRLACTPVRAAVRTEHTSIAAPQWGSDACFSLPAQPCSSPRPARLWP